MRVLQELLGAVSLHEFLSNHYARVPLAVPDTAAAYKDYLPEADVAAIVEDPRSILRIVQHARLIHDDARLSWDEARAYYKRGHTLLLRYAERSSPKLRALADDFADFFHAPVDIQLYLTPERAQAFGWHYDLEEVFIIQVQGCKEYTIRQNTVNSLPVWHNIPADMRYENETSRVRLTCRLEAGDWLYIPSGWWHIARTQEESIHMSIGVMPVARLKLFDFLTQRLSHLPFWCERLALAHGHKVNGAAVNEGDQRIWHDMRQQLHDFLAREETFAEFMAYLVDTQRAKR